LVVGAGPTGLVLAAELLARGIRTRIIDKGDGAALADLLAPVDVEHLGLAQERSCGLVRHVDESADLHLLVDGDRDVLPNRGIGDDVLVHDQLRDGDRERAREERAGHWVEF
jgi:2-polyprenyl-6-methoxyphenol hydroxylase-like FAD-dependent oxidoreductase